MIYTDEQVKQFATALGIRNSLRMDLARGELARLHEAGITVTFPEPRFYVQPTYEDRPKSPWEVVDRRASGVIARFWGVEVAERYAREHADRLNREAQP